MHQLSRSLRSLLILSALVAALAFAFTPSYAQDQPAEAATTSNASVTTVVSVLGPNYSAPPAIGKSDVTVYERKDKRNVTGWVPAQGDKANLELAIVIDEAVGTELGSQFGDLTKFINSLPSTTSVGIYYANNGTVQAASQFNTDHAAVAKSLRLPIGNIGAYSSIYLSLMDLVKRWPVTGSRREILLIADGIDRFRGDFPQSPDVQSTIDRAQTAGILIHTLYASGVGRFGHSLFRVNMGQSNLSQIADETGGESFFQGLQTPISFAPYLQNLDTVLKNQYFLTFDMPRPKKGKGQLRTFRVRAEQKGVEFSAPTAVFVPGP